MHNRRYSYKRHPLREDVSWNIYNRTITGKQEESSSSWGCELKYLMRGIWEKRRVSSSSWGCELKCLLFLPLFFEIYRHPLREDVSWNALLLTVVVLDAPVILFVRMWVEITDCFAAFKTSAGHPLREDVSWNLEEYGVNHRCSNMVLLVGRWIEIFLIVFLSFAWRSHYYTSFNLNIKLNYRNLRGNFYMCS